MSKIEKYLTKGVYDPRKSEDRAREIKTTIFTQKIRIKSNSTKRVINDLKTSTRVGKLWSTLFKRDA